MPPIYSTLSLKKNPECFSGIATQNTLFQVDIVM